MGGAGDGERPKKTVFITVGTTCFDSLVKAADSHQVKHELLKRGYTDLLIQMGRGSYIPLKCSGEDGSLAVDYFSFSPSIADYLKAASLIISHADLFSKFVQVISDSYGYFPPDHEAISLHLHPTVKVQWSGSIFETLRLGKPLIVVVNEDLMDNHQSELAEELAERKHLFCARPQTLYQTIQGMDLESLLPYPLGDAMPVAKLMNRFLGFPAD